MKSLYKILLCALVLGGCYSDKGYEPKTDYSNVAASYRVGNRVDLPLCTKSREGVVFYIENSGVNYACSDGIWVFTKEFWIEDRSSIPYFDSDSARLAEILSELDYPEPVYDAYEDERDGHVYTLVRIDGRWWFAENLDFEVARSVHIDYRKCDDFCGVGYYYADIHDACPRGFHVPKEKDWNRLLEYAGGKYYAGKVLKSKGSWDYDGLNLLGFSVLDVQYRNYGDVCYWTSTGELFEFTNYDEVQEFQGGNSYKNCSVRCVED